MSGPIVKDLEKRQPGDGNARCSWDTASATPRSPAPATSSSEQDVCPCAGERLERADRAGAADEPGRERRLRLEDRPGDARPRAPRAALPRRSARAGRRAGRRRCRRVSARRRPGPGADRRRLLPVGRRSLHVRADRRGQFAERRLRHGRPADHRPLDRRLSRSQPCPTRSCSRSSAAASTR